LALDEAFLEGFFFRESFDRETKLPENWTLAIKLKWQASQEAWAQM